MKSIELHNEGDACTGPFWIAYGRRVTNGFPWLIPEVEAAPSASELAAACWKRFGGDVPILTFPTRADQYSIPVYK